MSSHRYSWKFIVDKNHFNYGSESHDFAQPRQSMVWREYRSFLCNIELGMCCQCNAIATEIVGKAICDIAKGCELFQEYGESVAEIVHKYGFPTHPHAGFI